MGAHDHGDNHNNRESILARRVLFVASALGGLGLTFSRDATGQEPKNTAPVSSANPSQDQESLGKAQVGLSAIPTPGPRPTRGVLLGPTSEFWLPLAAFGEKASQPPYLLGASLMLGLPLKVSSTVEFQPAAVVGLLASTRGLLFPTGAQVQAVFSSLPGAFTALSLGGGWLVGSSEQHAGEWRSQRHAPFVQGYVTPFGFRFGEEARGELGIRFGGVYTKVTTPEETRWAFALVSTGAWIGYLF